MFHITQPLGINGLLDGYYKVMSNTSKMRQLPTPVWLHSSQAGVSNALAHNE